PSEDVVVFEDPNPSYFLGVGKTQSDRFFVIDSHDHETSEVHVLPADDPGGAPRLIAPRRAAEKYEIDEANGIFYILSNAGDAEDFKIVTAPVATPGREHWRDLVPHKYGCLILSHTSYRDWLVRLEREGGLPRIVVRNIASGEEHGIAFDEEAYSLGLLGSYEFATDTLRFTYSSMTTPGR